MTNYSSRPHAPTHERFLKILRKTLRIWELRYEGLTHKEIARITGDSLSTIAQTLAYGVRSTHVREKLLSLQEAENGGHL